MNKLHKAFETGKAFIPFVTAGDPNLDITERLVLGMAEAGADLIELGIPFSDPVAEGTVIQQADERALAAGTTTDRIFEMVSRLREKTNVPLAFMTYVNPIFVYGTDRFMMNCQKCNVDAVIVPDLPFEEKEELTASCRAYDIRLISLIAPTSKARIGQIASEAEGFIYCVSSLGVTGVRSSITTDIRRMISQVKAVRDIPCAIGFGISTPDQAREMASISDGVIVGSAIVKLVAQYGINSVEPVIEYVRTMKQAVISAGE